MVLFPSFYFKKIAEEVAVERDGGDGRLLVTGLTDRAPLTRMTRRCEPTPGK